MKLMPLLLSAGLVSNALYAEESSLNMALGSFDVGKSGTAMGQLEYRFGYDIEFYSQLKLVYRLASNAIIGLGAGHISNAGIGDSNPGAETVYLSYSISY